MAIKIKCIICGKEIYHPKMDQLCCDKKKCKDEFNANMVELWKMENEERVREMNKKSYKNRKSNSKTQ